MKNRFWRFLPLLALLTLAGCPSPVTPAPAPTPTPTRSPATATPTVTPSPTARPNRPTCTVNYAINNDWKTGFVVNPLTLTNNGPALTSADVVGPAIAAEDMFKYSALNPEMGSTIRALSKLAPKTLALMHGPSFSGDGAAALRALADDYDRRMLAAKPMTKAA